MNPIVDTHCHLDLDAFDADRSDVFRRALAAGVHAMVLVGYNPERWRTTYRLCSEHGFLTRTVGLHPNDAALWGAELCHDLRQEISRTRPIAIGEIGLDFYRSSDSAVQQARAFVAQLEIAVEFDLPVVIHQRAAEDEVLEFLAATPGIKGVMHCFTGGRNYSERCLELGFSLGIGGVITFPRSTEMREAILHVPLERMVLETDSPFLAPQVCRGKRNESSLLPSVLQELASLIGETEETVAERTTQNAKTLFGDDLSYAITQGMDAA